MTDANRSRYLPPSESEERELSAESPDETLSEMESRADTLDEIFKQQSAAAQGFIESIRHKLSLHSFGIPPTMEQVVQLQDAIQSLTQTQALCRLVRKELAVKRDEELRAIRNES